MGLSLVEMIGGPAVAAALGAGLMKGWTAWQAHRRTPEQRMGQAADAAAVLVTAATAAAEKVMDGMRQDFDALRKMTAQQADEIAELKRSHVDCEARCLALTQLGRQRDQLIESLIRQLSDPAATRPGGALHGLIVELNQGGALILSDESKPK